MKEHLSRSTDNVVKAEYITYSKKNGMLIKETSTRSFNEDGDYIDSYKHEPLTTLGQ